MTSELTAAGVPEKFAMLGLTFDDVPVSYTHLYLLLNARDILAVVTK